MDRKYCIFWLIVGIHVVVIHNGVVGRKGDAVGFDENYEIRWGQRNVLSQKQGRQIQLSMDNSSGSGFGSKLSYGSGFFHLRIKVPGGDSAGVVTAFYLASRSDHHDELDLEFLGNREGKPYSLQTNVYVNGVGNREQRINLWFDPSAAFHTYKILWNQHQIVFYVDNIPIRVFKNNEKIGVSYVWQPLLVEASIWNGEEWATEGGKAKINWSYAPFRASFRAFDINGCQAYNPKTTSCFSSGYWWNREQYWKLDGDQQKAYENVRKNYMTYDYCSDTHRFPLLVLPKECSSNA